MAKQPEIVTLVSRLPNPVNIPYRGSEVIVPPHGRLKGLEKNLLGALPTGVVARVINK